MFSKAQRRAQDLIEAAPDREECFNCPESVPTDEVLWGEKGEAYCSEACRDAVYGPEA